MERLVALKDKVSKEGLDAEYAIKELKEIREAFKEVKKPLCVKMCRLAYEYLEENGNFEFVVTDEEMEEMDADFVYFLELLINNDNVYNQQELRDYADSMS